MGEGIDNHQLPGTTPFEVKTAWYPAVSINRSPFLNTYKNNIIIIFLADFADAASSWLSLQIPSNNRNVTPDTPKLHDKPQSSTELHGFSWFYHRFYPLRTMFGTQQHIKNPFLANFADLTSGWIFFQTPSTNRNAILKPPNLHDTKTKLIQIPRFFIVLSPFLPIPHNFRTPQKHRTKRIFGEFSGSASSSHPPSATLLPNHRNCTKQNQNSIELHDLS